MRESDQDLVDLMAADNIRRQQTVLVAAPIDPLPGQVRAFLKAGQDADARAEGIARAGLEVWAMHSRKCRRNLQLRLKIQPGELWKHMQACTCHWPEQRLRETQA